MKMTDSSVSEENGSQLSGSKRPAPANGTPTGNKVIKFSGNSHSAGKDPHSTPKAAGQKTYSREEILQQRTALPIFPAKERYMFSDDCVKMLSNFDNY